jgi:hypothetical protein
MMVALFVYAYAIAVRSSRAVERRCQEDMAFRVITANRAPDHATIARFRVRHEAAIAELFGEVLGLCAHTLTPHRTLTPPLRARARQLCATASAQRWHELASI